MRTCGSDPAQITLDCTFESGRAWAEELESFPQSIAQARLTGPFGDLPLSVLSHDPDRLMEELPPEVRKTANDVWEQMQEELVHLSIQGSQQIAKNSSHYIQLDRPELVINEIRDIVTKVRE